MRAREMARVACRSTRETDGADMMTRADGVPGQLARGAEPGRAALEQPDLRMHMHEEVAVAAVGDSKDFGSLDPYKRTGGHIQTPI